MPLNTIGFTSDPITNPIFVPLAPLPPQSIPHMSQMLFLLLPMLLSLSEAACPPYGQLSVSGTKLKGSNGQDVALHGMSLFWSSNPDGAIFWNAETVKVLKFIWFVKRISHKKHELLPKMLVASVPYEVISSQLVKRLVLVHPSPLNWFDLISFPFKCFHLIWPPCPKLIRYIFSVQISRVWYMVFQIRTLCKLGTSVLYWFKSEDK